jgi:U3 small nucleolar ribonucleoprotein protein LCP5
MLHYISNIITLLSLKTTGTSIVNHPCIKNLVEHRLILEKAKPLEQKLKYQIDKLVKSAKSASFATNNNAISSSSIPNPAENRALENGQDPLQFRPNPLSLMNTSSNRTAAQSSASLDYTQTQSSSSAVYKPPRIAPMPYKDAGAEKDRKTKSRLSASLRESTSKSRILHDLRDALEARPEELTAHGTGYGPRDRRNEGDLEIEAVERAEEENYTRYSRTRDLNRREKALKRRGGAVSVQDELVVTFLLLLSSFFLIWFSLLIT